MPSGDVVDAERASWLEARRSGIGGSDAAVIVGLSSWKTARELYHEKRGEITDDRDSAPMEWGRRLEEVIAQAYAEQTGHAVQTSPEMIRHPRHSFMLANLDRWATTPQGERLVLECKSAHFRAGFGWGQAGSDEVPEAYLVQCQHYMAVTGAERADLAVLIGGSDFRVYHLRRDNELIQSLIVAEAAFWRSVQTGTPPPADLDHQSAPDFLRRLHRGTNGQTVDLPAEALEWHRIAVRAQELVKRYEAARDSARAHLADLMGEAAVATLPDGSGAYRRKLTKRAGFTVQPTEYVTMTFKENKE